MGSQSNSMGKLSIVATPIGNLEDITFRAIRILEEFDIVLCEDTRVTHKLLEHYHLETKTMSYFQHSNLAKVDTIIKMLEDGAKMALVTDAGTAKVRPPAPAPVSVNDPCDTPATPTVKAAAEIFRFVLAETELPGAA